MTESVDSEIIGGVVARVGDRLIDGSTRTQLRAMRDSLAERPVD
jgi:F-type H+-transporting ATPase subunit delta